MKYSYISLWSFLYLCIMTTVISSYCNDHKDCVSCTNSRALLWGRCRWCHLDRQCHTFGAFVTNACESDMNIKDPSRCYHESHDSDRLFSPDNAFIGTLLSAAAYSDQPDQCLKQILPSMDFQLVETVGMECDDFLFDYDTCFAYTAISHTSKTIILSYRGTSSPKQLIDEVLTILFIPKQSFVAGGKVQKYFKNAHSKLYPCIKESISELVAEFPDYNATITGHSLGGAMASLASAHLMKENVLSETETHLYTFGMPRVGNKRYALEHDKLVKHSWRIVHYRDIVSHLPTCNLLVGCNVANGPYHHGKEVYFGSTDMSVSSNFKICRGNEDIGCSDGVITAAPSTYDIMTCIKYHNYYFGVNIGKHCENFHAINRRSEMTKFPNDTCQRKRFPYRTNKTSSASRNSLGKGNAFVKCVAFCAQFMIVLVLI